ncbi:hypothetical protein BLA60_39480 [Actinophytocola xinjiangensis]|uniref:Uncharacterized protein n=1 Tax=Actinophytocola xinjiangensis TaxID=485602 RepID=A0A7Z0WD91_9PSEU|nr:hypothetical protein [Actinophytocola xinjiangensis]OLF04705.1 hypothetical protein BLA60_39480 [Actinophytocola xinjiangensis]
MEYSTNAKAARSRLRRASRAVDRDLNIVYDKPVSEWDFDELQRGRPRGPDGKFRTGPRPKWITDAVMAEARKRLKTLARDRLGMYAGAAIDFLKDLMEDDRVDENGRPITPNSVKLQAATYLLDQIVGKSITHVELEGSVNLRHLMATVMVNPDGEESHPVVGPTTEEEEMTDDA